MPKKKSHPFRDNSSEILWNVINSLLAGVLVLLGSLVSTQGEFSLAGISVAIIAAVTVAVTKIRDYWMKEESEYSKHMFKFV